MPRKKVVKQLQTAAEEGKKGGALYISPSPSPPRENVRLVKSGSAFVNCCNEGVYDCLIATAVATARPSSVISKQVQTKYGSQFGLSIFPIHLVRLSATM